MLGGSQRRKAFWGMSTEQKRAALKAKYPGSTKFDKMPDSQVHVIYMRLLNQKKL
jgi:hypothetical protein